MIRHIRQLGQEKILERFKAFKNKEHLPDDILSSILATNSYSQVLKVLKVVFKISFLDLLSRI